MTTKYTQLTEYESANLIHHLAGAGQGAVLIRIPTDIEFYELIALRGNTTGLLADATRTLGTALAGAAPRDRGATWPEVAPGGCRRSVFVGIVVVVGNGLGFYPAQIPHVP